MVSPSHAAGSSPPLRMRKLVADTMADYANHSFWLSVCACVCDLLFIYLDWPGPLLVNMSLIMQHFIISISAPFPFLPTISLGVLSKMLSVENLVDSCYVCCCQPGLRSMFRTGALAWMQSVVPDGFCEVCYLIPVCYNIYWSSWAFTLGQNYLQATRKCPSAPDGLSASAHTPILAPSWYFTWYTMII